MIDQSPGPRSERSGGKKEVGVEGTLTKFSSQTLGPTKVSFADQSYANIYGSRFEDVQLTMHFNLEGCATRTARKEQMVDIQRQFEGIIDSCGMQSSVKGITFLKVLGMANFTCTGPVADLLLAAVKRERFFESLADTTGSIIHTPEVRAVFDALWERGDFTTRFDPSTSEVGRFALHFSEGARLNDQSLYEVDTALHQAGLVGQVGVDLRGAEDGYVILTCSAPELRLFTAVTGLSKITSTSPERERIVDPT